MLGIVIDGLCMERNTRTAIDFLRAIDRGGRPCKPNAIVRNTIIDSLCKDKLVDQALALLEEMIEKGIYPSIVTYSSLIQDICNLSKWKLTSSFLR